MRRIWTALFAVVAFSAPALSQNYNQVVVFGDSTADAGYFANAKALPTVPGNPFDTAIATAVAAGGNAHFTGPGLNNSQILAGFFGTTANSVNAPGGGTNYAIGGAFVSNSLFPFTNLTNLEAGIPNPALPTTTGQIANYLTSVGGQANRNAIYLVSTGGNDVFAIAAGAVPAANINTYINAEAGFLTASLQTLQTAGARTIIVGDNYLTAGIAALPPAQEAFVIGVGTQLQTTIWRDLAAAGVQFIPADTNAVIAAVRANPGEFGITDITHPACVGLTASVTSAACTVGQLVAANALQTHLYVDNTHLTEAGQQIIADYYYSLLTAPSEISFLAENAIKTRLTLVSNMQDQINLSLSHRGPQGINAWVSGDVGAMSMKNFHGFPDDPNTVYNGAAGVDFAFAPGMIAGIAASAETLTAALGQFGHFRQQGESLSLYAGYDRGPLWGSVIGTYGHLSFDVNRVVPIGITQQGNNGNTGGGDWSAAFQGGYRFWTQGITHGPIVGFVLQDDHVGAFTETGSVTSLGFGSQTRDSAVGQFGYKATLDYWANLQPFGQLTWNHEFANTNRNVTATLTTIAAPSFSLPAVLLGKDWGEVKGGFAYNLGGGGKVLVTGSADFAQSSATVYGVQVGLNIAF